MKIIGEAILFDDNPSGRALQRFDRGSRACKSVLRDHFLASFIRTRKVNEKIHQTKKTKRIEKLMEKKNLRLYIVEKIRGL